MRRVLHITPSKESTLSLIQKIGTVIQKYRSSPILILIKKLNQIIRGWGNYHRHVYSASVFLRIDNYVRDQLWRMLHKRHSQKSKKWLFQRYWKKSGRKHIFGVVEKTKKGKRLYQVVRLSDLG
ncbi:MAG: group II intron maturase-specific domain-containing protein [bacterium]